MRLPIQRKNFLFTMSAVLALVGLSVVSCTRKQSASDNTVYTSSLVNIKGLDPIFANDVYSNEVVADIFETLLSYQYLKRPLTAEPRLAEQMPVTSDKGL